jgi:predicted RND superfamily exporter protein
MRADISAAHRFGLAIIDHWIGLGVRRPLWMFGIWGLVLVSALGGLTRLRVETSGESILDRSSDRWAFYQQSLDRFGNDEVIVAAIEAPTPYDPATLAALAEITRNLESAPGVRRVDSLSTLPIFEVEDGGAIRLDPAISPDATRHSIAEAQVETRVKRDRIAGRTVVSDDGTVFAMNVWPERGIEEHYDGLIERIRGTVAIPGAWVSGVPVFRTETNLRTQRELGVFVPATIAVMVIILFAAFRNMRGVFMPLGVSGLSVLILFGVMGWIGIPVSAPTMILPPVLLAIGSAYAMHLLTEAGHHRDNADIECAVREVARPIGLSGLTTAIGFASTTIVPIEAVQRVGSLGSFGTLIACAATTGLGAAIVSIWRGRQTQNRLIVGLRELASEVLLGRIQARAGLVIAGWLIILGLGFVGSKRLQVESDVVVWFPRGNEVRESYEEIKARLSGISPLNVVVQSDSGVPITDPVVIQAVDELGTYLASLPEVGKVLSIADPLRAMHEGLVGVHQLPSDRSTIEQYLLLLEGTERLGDVITADRTAANILLRVDNNGSRSLLDVAARADAWWREHGAPGTSAQTTGAMYEVARAEEAISLGQIQGLGLDVVIVAGILVVALRSVKFALLALVPNVLPIGLMFGFMGYMGIPLDLGTIFVSNLAVGIAVDETIHLVTAYARARSRGSSAEQALRIAMRRVVPALVLTTIVIAAGFLVLSVSEFRFTRNLGLLTTGVMIMCVASNTTLLPALLIKADGRRSQRILAT